VATELPLSLSLTLWKAAPNIILVYVILNLLTPIALIREYKRKNSSRSCGKATDTVYARLLDPILITLGIAMVVGEPVFPLPFPLRPFLRGQDSQSALLGSSALEYKHFVPFLSAGFTGSRGSGGEGGQCYSGCSL